MCNNEDVPARTSADLFFRIVLARGKSVLADEFHTDDGRRFWTARLWEALPKPNLRIGLANVENRTLPEITDGHQLDDLLEQTWRHSDFYRKLRWMIWKA